MRLTCRLSTDTAEEATFSSDTVNQTSAEKQAHVAGQVCFAFHVTRNQQPDLDLGTFM